LLGFGNAGLPADLQPELNPIPIVDYVAQARQLRARAELTRGL